jgi:hypothetical protein
MSQNRAVGRDAIAERPDIIRTSGTREKRGMTEIETLVSAPGGGIAISLFGDVFARSVQRAFMTHMLTKSCSNWSGRALMPLPRRGARGGPSHTLPQRSITVGG